MTTPEIDKVEAHDLVLERVVDVPRRKIWRAWTEPALLMRWFTPAPWNTIECEIDLRPGGIFRTVMRGPDGTEHDGAGCYLEIDRERRLVWTSALGPGFRPQPADGFAFTGIITLEDVEGGTGYTARAVHGSPEDARAHADMGFEAGWGAALDQLVSLSHQID